MFPTVTRSLEVADSDNPAATDQIETSPGAHVPSLSVLSTARSRLVLIDSRSAITPSTPATSSRSLATRRCASLGTAAGCAFRAPSIGFVAHLTPPRDGVARIRACDRQRLVGSPFPPLDRVRVREQVGDRHSEPFARVQNARRGHLSAVQDPPDVLPAYACFARDLRTGRRPAFLQVRPGSAGRSSRPRRSSPSRTLQFVQLNFSLRSRRSIASHGVVEPFIPVP